MNCQKHNGFLAETTLAYSVSHMTDIGAEPLSVRSHRCYVFFGEEFWSTAGGHRCFCFLFGVGILRRNKYSLP